MIRRWNETCSARCDALIDASESRSNAGSGRWSARLGSHISEDSRWVRALALCGSGDALCSLVAFGDAVE